MLSNLKIQWASDNGIVLHKIDIRPCDLGGHGIFAIDEIQPHEILLTIPISKIVSVPLIQSIAESDEKLHDLLESISGWASNARIIIVVFFIYLSTVPNEHNSSSKTFLEYINLLSIPESPILYNTNTELAFFRDTSLVRTIQAKRTSLAKEFELLKSSTQTVPFFANTWWPDESSLASATASTPSFQTYITFDAIFRSRALEHPMLGDVLVPVLDFANHSAAHANARYDVLETTGDVRLVSTGPSDGRRSNSDNTSNNSNNTGSNDSSGAQLIQASDEVTISYGSHKGSLEMLFSYGFLPAPSAGLHLPSVLIPFPPLSDAPLSVRQQAAVMEAGLVPGVRVFRRASDGQADWESEALWLVTMDENVVQVERGDNGRWIVSFEGVDIDVKDLRTAMKSSENWEVLQSMVLETVWNIVSDEIVEEEVQTDNSESHRTNRAISLNTMARAFRDEEQTMLRELLENISVQIFQK